MFSFLNRSAWPSSERIRNILENWFSGYPVSERRELRSRLRSNEDHQHEAAFFELLLHQLLVRLGCRVEVHPEIGGTTKRPDFLVCGPDGEEFFLEVALVTDTSPKAVGDQTRLNGVLNVIEDINSPSFFISVEAPEFPKSDVRRGRLATRLSSWLATLSHPEIVVRIQEQGLDGAPRYPWSDDGWNAEFIAIPRSSENQADARTLGYIDVGHAAIVNPAAVIQTKIEDKAKKYGDLQLPFVIAINCQGMFVDPIDIEDALFGPLKVVIRTGESRSGIGAWLSRGGPKNTRVSGVLVGRQIHPWSITTASTSLYLNPWAKRPYCGPLSSLGLATVRNKKVEFDSGISLGEILGLPQDWIES